MAGRNFLFVPGPTNVPDRVLRSMVIAMEDHRSPIFPELARACLSGLKPIFKTSSGTPFIFPSSGTGCWEAALTNCLNAGDKVLASRFGQFSHLWIDMCQRLGFDVEILETPWGEGAPVERYLASLSADKQHKIKAVLVCQNETATGVTSDVAAIRQAMDSVKHPALLVRGLGERARQHRLPHGRVGRRCLRQRLAEGPDAARRPRRHLRQPEGARGRQERDLAALLFRLRRHGASQRLGIFPLHPVPADALRPARSRWPCWPRRAWRTCSIATPTSPAACAPR